VLLTAAGKRPDDAVNRRYSWSGSERGAREGSDDSTGIDFAFVPHGARSSDRQPSNPQGSTEMGHSGRAQVIIVDDHPTFRDAARQCLRARGYDVVAEASGAATAIRGRAP
jgi:hypothetical protein